METAMNKASHVHHLKQRIKDLEVRLELETKQLEEGSPSEKVEAAGDLAVVQSRLEDMNKRLAKAQEGHDGVWENIKAEFEDDVGSIETSVARWMEKYGGI